jgi:hypothetical protein
MDISTLLLVVILLIFFFIYLYSSKNNKNKIIIHKFIFDTKKYFHKVLLNFYETCDNLYYNSYDDCDNSEYSDNFDNEYRDEGTCGIDRTDKKKLPWYHVSNKLINDKSKNYKRTNNSLVKCKNNKEKKIKNIVFNDNYEGSTIEQPNYDQNKEIYDDDIVDISRESKIDYELIDNLDISDDIKCHIDDECSQEKNIKNMKISSNDVRKFLKEKVLNGNNDCYQVNEQNKAKYTRDEAEDCLENQLQFREKIFGSSRYGEDVVDRLNQIEVSGGIQGNGQTIGEVYDNIVNNRATMNSKNIDNTNNINNIDLPCHNTLGNMLMHKKQDTFDTDNYGFYNSHR